MKKSIALIWTMIFWSGLAGAAGFDNSYRVRVGHYNADVLPDLFVSSSRFTPIAIDDIQVIVPPPVQDFVLSNNGNGTFSLVTQLSSTERAAARNWPEADAIVSVRDVDANGFDDLSIEGLPDIITGALDQIVHATRGRVPFHVTAKNAKFVKYHGDLIRWMLDPQFFTNVPLKLASSQPATAKWFGFVRDPQDFSSAYQLIQQCRIIHPTRSCGYAYIDPVATSADPKGCVRSVTLYDGNLQPVGQDPNHDVCQYELHVYDYVPASVTLQADTSVYDTDARETAEILKRLKDGCPEVPLNDLTAATELEQILARVWGQNVIDQAGGFVNVNNSESHPPFPGDGLFDTSADTYHHYDVTTPLCSIGQLGCDVATQRAILRYFSYPSYKLQPTPTAVNGVEEVLVRITIVPGNFARYYTIPGGYITQRFVTSGFWLDAVQNVTRPAHVVYPGTISRTITQKAGALQVFTHGVGINRLFCTVNNTALEPFIQMIMGFSNDVFGAAAFRALDREMKRYYQDHPLGPPQPAGAMQKPALTPLTGSSGMTSD
nr:hypothetical protein [uncultured Steroidobacter sp.]